MVYRHKIKRNGVNATTPEQLQRMVAGDEILGIAIRSTIGVGDALQYSSVPENYFRHTGRRLVDVDQPWFFDHNPYVLRDGTRPERVQEMWNFGPRQYDWPNPRGEGKPRVYLSNAEIHAGVFECPAALTRPRLYMFEEFPFEQRQKILLHTDGKSHGPMPDQVLAHVLAKYGPTDQLYLIGKEPMRGLGLPWIETKTLWDLAALISGARMVIGMDSGPAWIAAAYPDVVVKKLRTKPAVEYLENWVPLEIDNIHAHWDDRCHQIFNPTERSVGFTAPYTQI